MRVAHHACPDAPPALLQVTHPDPLEVIEEVCALVEERSSVPAPAVREVIENLVHARFADAVVSIADGGATVRVSDHGPGIPDPQRALLPGFTSAGPSERAVVRGVGGGLPLAARLMEAVGGALVIEENLGSGAAVTLALPAEPVADQATPLGDTARLVMALLVELGRADAGRVAHELGRDRAECGRELALLQHRGLVVRTADRSHALTDAGTALLATLF
ncbi:MAG: ATP-binding protein [Miltoncostaeaceae bacterium]